MINLVKENADNYASFVEKTNQERNSIDKITKHQKKLDNHYKTLEIFTLIDQENLFDNSLEDKGTNFALSTYDR